MPAFIAGVDDTGTAHYIFREDGGGETVVAGETLEWMQDEALRHGITLEELWKIMVGQNGSRIWRHLQQS